MILNVDIHIHSRYTVGVSKRMDFETIIEYSKLKGLNAVGICDVLFEKWEREVKEFVGEKEPYFYDDLWIIPCQEAQDKDRVHHILIFPSFREVRELREKLKGKGKLDTGRAILKISGRELFEICKEIGILIGPAHAFTPYYGLYSKFDSIEECYRGKPNFLELGLSADSYLANRIEELKNIVFLSNSDTHRPERIAREFQRIKLKDYSFEELEKLFEGKRKIVFNAGLDPRHGKYHLTACNRCYRRYSLKNARILNFKCKCGGKIKIGVKDRIEMLSNFDGVERPKYYHILPLDEIVEKVGEDKKYYNKLIKEFGNEINVLIDAEIEEIKRFSERIARAIEFMRKDEIMYDPGGGGRYGEVIIPKNEEEFEKIKKKIEEELKKEMEIKQRSIFDFI